MGWLTSAGEATTVVNPVIGGVMTLAGKVLDNLYPDPVERAKAQQALDAIKDGKEARELDANLKVQLAQIAVDAAEAQSDSLFKSGWRPFIGWVCGTAFAWNYVGQPALEWFSAWVGHPIALPHANLTAMMPILGGLLGLGTLRTVEKIKGSA
jgi:hypothetical protein